MRPTLLRIIINPAAGHEEEVRQALLTRLNAYEHNGVLPILLRWIRASFDLELLVAVYDFARVDDLFIDVIRSIENVADTSSTIMYDGFMFPGGFLMAENAHLTQAAFADATVDIRVAPGADRETFAALYDLPEADDLHKIMLFKSYTHADSDFVLHLGGYNRETIESYIQVFVRAVPGVTDTFTTFTFGWAMLIDPESFTELQAQFAPL